jgi:sugar phosphate isomerase/epimerase
MQAKVSVGSSAFATGVYAANPIPLRTVARRLADLGYDGLELYGARPHAHPDKYPTKPDRYALRNELADLNLEISNYCADLWGYPLGVGEHKAREYEDAFKHSLEFCVDCGIDSIRVDTVSEPSLLEGVAYGEVWQRVVTTWQRCARWAGDAMIDVYWEFEPGNMFNKPSEVVRLVDEVGTSNFRVMFDTCHAQVAGVIGARQPEPREIVPSVVDLVHFLGNRIGTVHLIDSDNSLHDGKTSTHAPFGQGVLNFDAIVAALKEEAYRGPWWTIDLCFWPTAWDILDESKQFIVDLLVREGLR